MKIGGGPATVIPPLLKEGEPLNEVRKNKRKPLSKWMGRLVKGRESQEILLDAEVTGLRGKVKVLFLSPGFFHKGPGDFFIGDKNGEINICYRRG